MTQTQMPLSPDPLLLTPSDLRQWHYCPRVIFFERCTPVFRRETILMAEGREQHQTELWRERRRQLSRYDLAEGERRYDVRLMNAALGLHGELDLLIVNQNEAYPVEFKHSARSPDAGHKLQMCAYALLIEAELGHASPHGYWHSSRTRQTHTVAFDTRLRNRTHKVLAEIRACISQERCPPPTTQTAKCWECELKNFCGDTC